MEGAATLILLPSPHILPPPPNNIHPTNLSSLETESEGWLSVTVQEAQDALFDAVGEGSNMRWDSDRTDNGKRAAPPRRRGDFGEGGMYI